MHALGKASKYLVYGAMAAGRRISKKITSGNNFTEKLPGGRRVARRAPSGHETDGEPPSSKGPSTPEDVRQPGGHREARRCQVLKMGSEHLEVC